VGADPHVALATCRSTCSPPDRNQALSKTTDNPKDQFYNDMYKLLAIPTSQWVRATLGQVSATMANQA
jgi:hypothetical protein